MKLNNGEYIFKSFYKDKTGNRKPVVHLIPKVGTIKSTYFEATDEMESYFLATVESINKNIVV